MAELASLGVKPEDIDTCYKLFTQTPIGTMEMGDTSGIDISIGSITSIYEGLGDERYRPHPYICRLAAAGRLGVKTGQGFYDWTNR